MKMYLRNLLDNSEVELTGSDIAFGDGLHRVTISIRGDRVDIRALHGRLLVIPQASNCIEVQAESFLPPPPPS